VTTQSSRLTQETPERFDIGTVSFGVFTRFHEAPPSLERYTTTSIESVANPLDQQSVVVGHETACTSASEEDTVCTVQVLPPSEVTRTLSPRPPPMQTVADGQSITEIAMDSLSACQLAPPSVVSRTTLPCAAVPPAKQSRELGQETATTLVSFRAAVDVEEALATLPVSAPSSPTTSARPTNLCIGTTHPSRLRLPHGPALS